MADALPWLKLETDFPESDDADLLEEILGVPRAWTHVVELWCWVGRQRPTGDVTGLPVATLAKRAGWLGDPEVFVDALRQVGLLVTVEDPGIEPRTYVGGWAKRYAAALEKRVRDKERKAAAAAEKKRKQEEAEERRRAESARKSRGSDDDSATNPRGGSAEATGKSKSTEQEQDPLAAQEGVQGEALTLLPPPARPEPPPKKTRARRDAPTHASLPDLLADCPTGTHLGVRRDGARTYLDIWRGHFKFIGDLDTEARRCWDHKARKKYTDMPLYVSGWLAESNARAEERWLRRPENRPRPDETPGDTRTRARVETERAHQQRNPAYVGPDQLMAQALKAGAMNDDPDAAAEGRALLRSRVGIRDGPDSRRVVEALTGEGSRGPQGGAGSGVK